MRVPLAASLLILSSILLLGLPPKGAWGQDPVRVTRVRVGVHADYERAVIQLSGAAPAEARLEPTGLVLDLQARPALTRPLPGERYRHMGSLALEETDRGSQVRFASGAAQVRAFRLSGPARIVVDFAPATAPPLLLAEGLEALAVRPLVSTPPAPPVESVPTPEPVPEPAPEVPETAEPGPATVEVPEPGPPTPPAEVAPPEVAPTPLPPVPEVDGATWAERLGMKSRLGVALWIGIPFLVLAGVIWTVGRRSGRFGGLTAADLEPLRVPSPDDISGERIVEAGERIDLLEKRIDEEVRRRIELEERASRLQQNLKVVEDRMQRLARRGEGQ